MDWLSRFEAVVQRKTREAAAADLPPFHTVAVGDVRGLDRVGSTWTRRIFDGDFYLSPIANAIPATSLVFVQSSDGNTGARNPSSLGGGATDKHLVYEGLSRVAADGVLAGAETIRGTNVVFSVWRRELVELREAMRLPRHPAQIVATLGRLTFEDTLLLNVAGLPAVVVSTRNWLDQMRPALRERPWIRSIGMTGPDDLPAAFRALRAMGIRRISAIGGRTIARALIGSDLVRDLYLTTSPRPGGEPGTPLSPKSLKGTTVVRKTGTGAEAGVVFEHLVI